MPKLHLPEERLQMVQEYKLVLDLVLWELVNEKSKSVLWMGISEHEIQNDSNMVSIHIILEKLQLMEEKVHGHQFLLM